VLLQLKNLFIKKHFKEKKVYESSVNFFSRLFNSHTTFAQNLSNVVTIKVNSSRTQEVLVDGKSYPLTNENNPRKIQQVITLLL
jgi:hypothetical protein